MSFLVNYILAPLFIGLAVAITIALVLIATQYPQGPRGLRAEGGLDLSQVTGHAAEVPLQPFAARDGAILHFRAYPAVQPQGDSAARFDAQARRPLLVMVHGSGWHGAQLDQLASTLASAGAADVIVPDLRGHGPYPVRRGDVDYIGQLEDDLADLIASQRAEGQPVILLGHSSGGGLVIRFAGGQYGHELDGAILLAPYIQHNAPTTRPRSGGWAHPLVRRIIGLSMLNTYGIHALDHLTTIEFAFPPEFLQGPMGKTATTAYSHRLLTSFGPRRRYQKDLAALPSFLLLVGAEDEAFYADQYEPTMSAANPRGAYMIVPKEGHLSIVDAPQSAERILQWLRDLQT